MSILLFFLILLLLVLVHEFGHFIVAKLFKIRVDEFAFGFPPRIFSIKKGETNYSFNALPIGGYVSIYGENALQIQDDADKGRSFAAKSRWVQSAVIVAGVVFNLILAWILISGTLMMGIASPADNDTGYPVQNAKLMVTELAAKGPAETAGLKPGDTLVSLSDGVETVAADSPEAVSSFIGPREGKEIMVTYTRKGEAGHVNVTPIQGISQKGAAIGIYMDMVGTLKLPFFAALKDGAVKTYLFTKLTAVGIYTFIYHAVAGDADYSQVTGPVGIVGAVGEAAGIGFANLVLFTALISINLAVINIIPFPALDGGRFLFILIEGITRKPIKPQISNVMNFVGFALLMLLMVAVTYHDVAKLMR